MEILKYRKDANSPWQDIAAIVGPMGPQGEPGKDGTNGIDGKDGLDGKDGYTPVKGVDYFDGKDGKDGEQGPQGIPGEPGKDGAPGEKGEAGKPFTYEDFTPEQLEALRGPQGEPGPAGETGEPGTTNYNELENQPIIQVDILPAPSTEIINNIYKTPYGLYKLAGGPGWKVPEVGDHVIDTQVKLMATDEEVMAAYTGDNGNLLTFLRKPELPDLHNDVLIYYDTAGEHLVYMSFLTGVLSRTMAFDTVCSAGQNSYVESVNTDSALYGKILVYVESPGYKWVEAFNNGISEEERQSIIDEVTALIPSYAASEEVSF